MVAGASGYIGKEILPLLLEKFPNASITALSRVSQSSPDARISWKACDLFSLKSLEEALPKKIDYALYLVHSMGPTARLDQGSFADYDIILADNFSRALKNSQVKQMVYLGGLIPEDGRLSLHLQSRLEVEETFLEHQIPTTVFRAGLILGEAGTSFQILIKLVKRLPVMICPHWTQTLTAPVDLQTVVTSIATSVSRLSDVGKVYDLTGCQPLSYLEMMRATAIRMGLHREFIGVPFFTPTLSRLWVSLITNSPKNLVYPLIESLEHPMLPRESHLFSTNATQQTYADLLDRVSVQTRPGRSLFRFQVQRSTVRSVQRVPLPPGMDSKWIKEQYTKWLPKFLRPFIGVTQNGKTTIFSFFSTRISLLELTLNEDKSNSSRQLLYITGGLLVSKKNKGRLEFRVVLKGQSVIVAIHDFKPALPWFIYKFTQARLHLLVMNAFGRHLALRN